jgi:hypothetical protein
LEELVMSFGEPEELLVVVQFMLPGSDAEAEGGDEDEEDDDEYLPWPVRLSQAS